MQTALLGLVPLIHILLVVAFVVGAVVNARRNPGLAGLLALLALAFTTATVWLFLGILRGS